MSRPGPDYGRQNDILAAWQFASEMKPGDVIFVKRGLKEIIGRGASSRVSMSMTKNGICTPHSQRLTGPRGKLNIDRNISVENATSMIPTTRNSLNELHPLLDSDDSVDIRGSDGGGFSPSIRREISRRVSG